MKKRIISLLLVILITFAFIPTAFAFGSEILSHVDSLNALGLFNGTGTDAEGKPIYDLDKSPTRTEALVMLIRLMGDEAGVREAQYTHPFDDVPEWADAYVGFAYETGLTVGIGGGKFGGEDTANALQYATFLLRALGYSEAEGDFTYDSSLKKLGELGMRNPEIYREQQSFTRDEIVEMSYSALYLSPKGQTNSLANVLLWKDVFTTKQLSATYDGALFIAADMPDFIPPGVTVYNENDLRELILLIMRNGLAGTEIFVPGFTGPELRKIYDDLIGTFHQRSLLYYSPSDSVLCWNDFIEPSIKYSDYVMMEFYYENPERYEKNYYFYSEWTFSLKELFILSMTEWIEEVDAILSKIIKPGMTEKEKVRAIHDYLVLHTTYDASYPDNSIALPHRGAYVVLNGTGVCDGYAEAFKILANGAGLEAKLICGTSQGEGHAWNQVKIDGKWYNIDVTWDDPDYGSMIFYDYFCKSDSVFERDHSADKNSYPERCPNSLS